MLERILFVCLQSLEPNHGISFKIQAQVAALCNNGFDARLAITKHSNSNRCDYFINENLLGTTFYKNYNLFRNFSQHTVLLNYIKKEKIKNVYLRWDWCTVGLLFFLLDLKHSNVKIFMEIPTYPYYHEWDSKEHDWIVNFPIYSDKLFCHLWRLLVSRIITFSNDKTIHGVKCLNISNGFIPQRIKIKKTNSSSSIHMIAVAMVKKWHGFDRILEGLKNYTRSKTGIDVTLTIVGNGEVQILKEMVTRYNLSHIVHFTGAISGDALDAEFEKANVAIGSLGRHRSGIYEMRSLKNVEYAARGIPFIYSENNPDFDGKPFVLKIPADESPLDILSIITFLKNISLTPNQIHQYALPYSWDNQLKIVSNAIKELRQ